MIKIAIGRDISMFLESDGLYGVVVVDGVRHWVGDNMIIIIIYHIKFHIL